MNSLSEFELIEELGRGSYGKVWKAEHIPSGQIYAIKQTSVEHYSSSKQGKMLSKEKILTKIDHPNLTKFLESFIERGYLFTVMQFIVGTSFQSLIHSYKQSKKSIPEKYIWAIVKQVISALNYLHRNQITHRELTSSNIYINSSDEVKIGYFGVSTDTWSLVPFENLLFMAPELIEKKIHDHRVDIWALGCLLYHMTALKLPFRRNNVVSLGIKIGNTKHKPIPRQYSKYLKFVVDQCLCKSPGKRIDLRGIEKFLEVDFKKQVNIEQTRERIGDDSDDYFRIPVFIIDWNDQPAFLGGGKRTFTTPKKPLSSHHSIKSSVLNTDRETRNFKTPRRTTRLCLSYDNKFTKRLSVSHIANL